MATQKDEKLQIVAFSTNDTVQTPNDIINIFLGQQNHKILKKSKFAIAFSTMLKNQSKETRIMICSVLNLSKEYTGITDVNCYLLFIDLEKKDSLDKLKDIINYAKDNCRLSKKIFVLGMISGNEEEEVQVAKLDITKILDALNANEFDFVSVAARWKTLSDFQKALVWMWYRAYPTDEYYCYACKQAQTADEIPARLRDEILLISNRSEKWIQERMAAVRAVGFTSFDDGYFALLDKIPLPETRLQLLTYQTHEEKTYAVKVISGMLRSGAEPDAIGELIADDYPAMSAYLRDKTNCDTDVDDYMAWYRRNKIINRYPGEYGSEISFDRFDTRTMLMLGAAVTATRMVSIPTSV